MDGLSDPDIKRKIDDQNRRSTRSTPAHTRAMFTMVTSLRLLQLQSAAPAAARTPRTRRHRPVRSDHCCASDARPTLIWRIAAHIKVPSAGTATRLDIWNTRAYLRRRAKAKLEYTIWTNNWSLQVRPVLIIRLN